MLTFENSIVILSILLQVSVAVMAISKAIKAEEKHKITWSMLSVVFSLMSFRRIVSFLVSLGVDIPFVFPEIVAFTISLLLCISVYNIRKILPSLEFVVEKIPGTATQLKYIATELMEEIEQDKDEIDEFISNGERLKRSKNKLQDASVKLVDIAHNLERLTGGTTSLR